MVFFQSHPMCFACFIWLRFMTKLQGKDGNKAKTTAHSRRTCWFHVADIRNSAPWCCVGFSWDYGRPLARIHLQVVQLEFICGRAVLLALEKEVHLSNWKVVLWNPPKWDNLHLLRHFADTPLRSMHACSCTFASNQKLKEMALQLFPHRIIQAQTNSTMQ